MILKLANLSLIILIALVALSGCDRAQKAVLDVPSADATMDETMMDMETTPVKLVWLVDYPEGGKDIYLAWIASIAPTLQAPAEVNRIRSYDNVEADMRPSRFVEFEFDSFVDAMTYMNRLEIAAVFEDLPNHATQVSAHTFIERSDYAKTGEDDWPIKGIIFVEYPLGGKAAYLEWVASISAALAGPAQLKAVASYDNYNGENPHRLVELEFASQADATAYEELEEIIAIETELDVRAGSWVNHTFELRSDYINE